MRLAQAPQQRDPAKVERQGKAMIWTGVGLMAGGVTAAVLAGTTLQTTTQSCDLFTPILYECTQRESLNDDLLRTGVGLVVGGAVLAILGAQLRLTVQPGAVVVSRKLAF